MPISKHNRGRYPANWATEIRPAMLARAGNACEGSPAYPDCRAANGEPHPITGSVVVLTIGHLNHIPEDCSPSNLKAWCQRCHLTFDAKQHQRSRRSNQERERGQLVLGKGLECSAS